MLRTPVAVLRARFPYFTARSIPGLGVLLTLVVLAPTLTAPAAGAEKGADDELKKVQGTWERTETAPDAPYRRATKEVKGNKETVTYFDADGKVTHQHRVDFKLSKAGDVGLFTFSNFEVTEGPQKGQKMEGESTYVYRATDEEFREAQGFLPGDAGEASVNVWKKAGAKGDAAAAAPQGAKALDAKALAGTWEPTMSQRGGNVEPEEQSKRHRLIFDGDRFTITRDGDVILKGTYKLKADAKPAQIDMTIEESQQADDRGKVVKGIIELTGDGLKWCTSGPRGTDRPTEFASEDGSRDMYVLLKREKKDAKP
jgi:uncharacterized protein (TIGR03067 family)